MKEKSAPTRIPLTRVFMVADADQTADAMAEAWKQIEEALTPIIGQRGFAALCQRTLFVNEAAYPWLAPLRAMDGAFTDVAALRTLLGSQSAAVAASASNSLLQTFESLLAGLIGPALTVKLLRPTEAGGHGDSDKGPSP